MKKQRRKTHCLQMIEHSLGDVTPQSQQLFVIIASTILDDGC